MRGEPVQHVMTVLPDRFDNNERRGSWDVAENFHAVFLTVYKAVPLGRIERMTPLHLVSASPDGFDNGCLHGLLSRPTFLIGGQTQIATGDEKDGYTHFPLLWHARMLS